MNDAMVTGSGFKWAVDVAEWPLREPFVISNYRWDSIKAVSVHLSQGNATGRAEGTPLFYRDETAQSLADSINEYLSHTDALPDREEIRTAPLPGGARNALDCALLELTAKQQGRSIAGLLGIPEPRPVRALATVTLEAPDHMAAQAKALSDIPVLKMKLDAHDIERRVTAVRNARPDAELLIDANTAWSMDLLRDVAPRLAAMGVAMIEQPLAPGNDGELSDYSSPIPLCADESCQTIADLDDLRGRYAMVNIKLDKCGGLTAAVDLARAAAAQRMRIMVGNMLGSSLAMAPAYLLAQFCAYADLDGPLSLTRDHERAMQYRDGLVTAPTGLWG